MTWCLMAQSITWANVDWLQNKPFGTNFSGILIKIQNYSSNKMYFKMLPAKGEQFFSGLNIFRISVQLFGITDFLIFKSWILCHPTPCQKSKINLGMGSANERRRYNVTSSLIGWAHTQNDPWKSWVPHTLPGDDTCITHYAFFFPLFLTPPMA